MVLAIPATLSPPEEPEPPLALPRVCAAQEDAAEAVRVPQGWQLCWSDEFSGTKVDASRWGVYHNDYGAGNKELACLTPDNVSVAGGTLRISARREDRRCPNGRLMQYTSGFLGSRDADPARYYPLFGRFEIRARVPHAQGLWPAFWLRHREGSAVAEVDVLEVFHSRDPGTSTSSLHLPESRGRNIVSGTADLGDAPGGTGPWHTFSVEILPMETAQGISYRFAVDGATVASYSDTRPEPRITSQPEATWDLAVNLAVGGRWVGHPDAAPGYLPELGMCSQTGDPPPLGNMAECPKNGVRLANLSQAAAFYEIDFVKVYVPESG